MVAPSGNLTSLRIEVSEFGSEETVVGGVTVRSTPVESDLPLFSEPPFPVDLVYTWVDGSDPEWRRRKKEVTRRLDPRHVPVDSDVDARFENRDELRYSLRSVSQYADFVNHVYLVTDSQIPGWLDLTAPGLTVIDHRELFGASGVLPTFNSHAIESRLHHIEGLAEHYVYMNDDFMFGRRVDPTSFFHLNGVAKFFMSHAVIAHEHLSVDRAANNARRLLEGRFGRRVTNKMKHAPYPQRRSVLEAMEADFPEAFATTAANQLRSPTDVPIASSMAHYYAFFTHEAVPASISNGYVDIGAADALARLALIAEMRAVRRDLPQRQRAPRPRRSQPPDSRVARGVLPGAEPVGEGVGSGQRPAARCPLPSSRLRQECSDGEEQVARAVTCRTIGRFTRPRGRCGTEGRPHIRARRRRQEDSYAARRPNHLNGGRGCPRCDAPPRLHERRGGTGRGISPVDG